ncbi:MAG TPA: hypothetical protein VF974_04520 [Patescibacteria group bacterium]
MYAPGLDPSTSSGWYNFQKNTRILVMVLGLIYFVFGAGAVFTGYKPTVSNYAVLIIILLNLINALVNKPTPPRNEQTTRETPETK